MENLPRNDVTCPFRRTNRVHGEGPSDFSWSKILVVATSFRSNSISGLLRQLRCEFVKASSAAGAVGEISTGGVELVLADMSLGDMGALELCRTIKQSAATQFLPVFVMAETDDPETEVRAIEAGADAFLSSPLNVRRLGAHIRAGLRRKALVDRLDDSESVLLSLAKSVEGRDGSLGGHCERLAAMASTMGMLLGLAGAEIIALHRGGYLHDIGKVAVPDDILFKAEPLTSEEWVVMKSHAERGERICSAMRSLRRVLPIIRHHHERWDGTGYPDGLRGNDIPLLARILQLADIYDALTTKRAYKRALSPTEAISIIREETAKGWRDPELTELFADKLPALSKATRLDTSRFSLQALAANLKQQDFSGKWRELGLNAIQWQYSN